MTFACFIIAVLALASFAGVTGTGKRGRPKGSHNAPRKSAAERFAALFARIPSMVWSLLREAMDPEKPGYVKNIARASEGLARCRKDSKKFNLYGNPITCAARVKHLRDRADRIEAFGAAIRDGSLKASAAIAAGDAAFAAISQAVKDEMLAGREPSLGPWTDEDGTEHPGIFAECFPPETLRLLTEYVETKDPFAGTDDETDDDADDEPAGRNPGRIPSNNRITP